jgi:hypothetical protein
VTYRVFKRSCLDWSSFSRARKITVETGLTFEEARERCDEFNSTRNEADKKAGTKFEFEGE